VIFKNSRNTIVRESAILGREDLPILITLSESDKTDLCAEHHSSVPILIHCRQTQFSMFGANRGDVNQSETRPGLRAFIVAGFPAAEVPSP
jgi:hypothetical protein